MKSCHRSAIRFIIRHKLIRKRFVPGSTQRRKKENTQRESLKGENRKKQNRQIIFVYTIIMCISLSHLSGQRALYYCDCRTALAKEVEITESQKIEKNLLKLLIMNYRSRPVWNFFFLNCARARLGYPSLPCAPARIKFLKNDPFLKFLQFLFATLRSFFCPAVKKYKLSEFLRRRRELYGKKNQKQK